LEIPIHFGGFDVVYTRRWQSALLTLAVVCICSQLLMAHAIIMSSVPAPNAKVKGPDVDITLRYNVCIDGGRSRLQLTKPDGSVVPLTIAKQDAQQVLQSKATGLTPGAYRLLWHVLASDGHMSKGEVPFTVE
jgi:copper resistance protein C